MWLLIHNHVTLTNINNTFVLKLSVPKQDKSIRFPISNRVSDIL